MDKFTVMITFKNHKQKLLEKVDKLTYDIDFVNNKWLLYLNISCDIGHKPKYYRYKGSSIDKVIIMNKTLVEYMEGR